MAEERVHRRLAAILAADVVGYSGLMEKDEAGTLARLKSLRAEFINPKIAEHDGRIVKTMGDGVLVEFPSAVDAVQCAVNVQRVLSRLNEDVAEDDRIELRIRLFGALRVAPTPQNTGRQHSIYRKAGRESIRPCPADCRGPEAIRDHTPIGH